MSDDERMNWPQALVLVSWLAFAALIFWRVT